ncbi:hypothetical protein PVK06_025389 [Gossypium arboreum]|uniref:DUF4283 domain-containing protein n=1 Tax=Gossypium arboreum TaxID=29729 RepID=A0ABR0PGC1_GOSAR|nr:hypothetical protein PVK06_025389 [Gossypium arboreum]
MFLGIFKISPWLFGNGNQIFKGLDFSMNQIPVWGHLSNIPLELFTSKGLSYIASALGNPLYMYAKVCFEMNANLVVPRFVEVELQDGSVAFIIVEMPWMPHRCLQCNVFGLLTSFAQK